MSKSFSKTINFNGTIDQVIKMYQTEEFWKNLFEDAVSQEVAITQEQDEVHISLEIETDVIPDIAKKFAGSLLTVWDQLILLVSDSGESCTGTQKITTSISQASARANLVFTGTSTGTSVTYDGSVKLSIPLVAGAFEDQLRKFVIQGLEALEELGNEWLKGH